MGGSVAWAARWAAHSVGDWMLTRSQRPCSRPACRSSSNEPACGSSGASVPAEGSRGRGRQGGKDEGGGGGRGLTVETDLGRTTVDVREGLGPAGVVLGVLAPRLHRVRLRVPEGLEPVRDLRGGRRRHALRRTSAG
mgnify:CR=1 FL=1